MFDDPFNFDSYFLYNDIKVPGKPYEYRCAIRYMVSLCLSHSSLSLSTSEFQYLLHDNCYDLNNNA